jgi:predicted phage tail component-like protein
MVSITFNGTDLSTFGLELQQITAPITQEAKFAQLQDKAYLFEAVRPGKVIQLSCIIYADNLTDLLTKIDNINKVIAIKEPKPLILGHQTDRYWMAQFQQMTGPFTGIGAYEIELVFFAADPLAYAVDETIYITTLNTDPWIRTLNVTYRPG